MGKLLKLVEERKAEIIEHLIVRGVYKEFDSNDLTRVPLSELEKEYDRHNEKFNG